LATAESTRLGLRQQSAVSVSFIAFQIPTMDLWRLSVFTVLQTRYYVSWLFKLFYCSKYLLCCNRYFLAHLDDGHKQIFYSWMYFHRLVNNDRSTIDRSMDYEYRLSSGSELFRAHSFLHFITNMMTVNQQRKYEIESVLTPIGVVKSRFSQDWMALVVDYDSPCSVSFYYECSTPESQNNCIDDYNRQLHPKNNDNDRTLATRPTLTTAQKKKQLNERSNLAFLESLMRSD